MQQERRREKYKKSEIKQHNEKRLYFWRKKLAKPGWNSSVDELVTKEKKQIGLTELGQEQSLPHENIYMAYL